MTYQINRATSRYENHHIPSETVVIEIDGSILVRQQVNFSYFALTILFRLCYASPNHTEG